MGRHSAPDDSEAPAAPPAAPPAVIDVAQGRHHVADEDTHTSVRELGGTHADLRLLRESPALRARCAAAAIVPFLLYTAALVLLRRTDVYLVWIWIPTVSGGVGVGFFLDVAHRRAR
jgi:hypothetical protein